MKNIFFCVVVFLFLKSGAQKITTTESEVKFYTGMRNAVTTTIYETSAKDAIAEWEKYLKTFKYEEISDSRNEVKGHNLFFKDILDRPVDIYSTFTENKEEKTVTMSTALDMGASNYLKSDINPAEVKVLEKMVANFAREATKAPFAAYLKAAIDHQEKLGGEQTGLEKDSKKINEDIAGYKSKLEKVESRGVQIKTDLETKKIEVSEQKKITDTISDPENARSKSYKKTLEKLMIGQKDLEKNLEGQQNDLKIIREKIARAEDAIRKNEDKKAENVKEIQNQKMMAEKWRKRLSEIS